jgi:hypothetical protein
MRKTCRAISAVTLVLVLNACSGAATSAPTAPAPGPSPDVRTEHVPFKGTLEGRLTSSVPREGGLLSNLIEASGTATQLGRFTLAIPHVVNRATRTAVGQYVFTAANGDVLTADFTSQATVIAPGVLSSADTLTITGGTGRFSGATGTVSAERTFVMATGETTGTFEGTISPRGDRH